DFDELLEREEDFAFGFAFFSPLPSDAASSPRTMLRLSSSAAIRSGALVGSGSSLGALTTSLPAALRSSRSRSSSRYSSRYWPGLKPLVRDQHSSFCTRVSF